MALVLLLFCNGCTRSRPTVTSATALPTTPLPAASTLLQSASGAVLAGQTIYVPAYSHIYYHDQQSVINLTVTLSIRNADPTQTIWVNSVQYYNAAGALVRTDLAEPQQLAPLASLEYIVEEDDTTGGSGASFLVKWSSATVVVDPVVEAVMISAASTQGISFISVGRVIEEVSAPPPAGN